MTIERFPYSFDLVGLVERCTVGVRWRIELSLAGYLDCSVDKYFPPDPDLLTTNFAELPRLNVGLEGLAELAAVPLSLACMSQEKPDSALVSSDENPKLGNTGQQGEAPATVPMMVCYFGLGTTVEATRVGPDEERDG